MFISYRELKIFLAVPLITAAQTVILFVFVYPEFYNNGDNEYYRKAYSVISELDIFTAYKIFTSMGGSGSEPLSFLLFYIPSKFFTYQTFFYASNFIFVCTLGFVLSRLYRQWFLSFVLLSFSFYVFIGSGLTQRLAFAIIFWMLSEISQSTTRRKLYQLLSILSHWQMLIFYFSKLAPRGIFDLFSRFKLRYELIGILLVFLAVLIFAHESLLFKFQKKFTGLAFNINSILVLLWPILILLCGFKRLKYEHISVFVFLFFVAAMLSTGRINIICFFYSIFLMKDSSRSLFFFSLILTPYFIYKHVDFAEKYYIPGVIFG